MNNKLQRYNYDAGSEMQEMRKMMFAQMRNQVLLWRITYPSLAI